MGVPTVRMVKGDFSCIVNADEAELWRSYGFALESDAASAPAADKAAPKRRKGKQ